MPNCNNKKYENEFVNLMNLKGYPAMRIAGSGIGEEAVCDCVMFRDGRTFLVEVKATKEEKFYFRQGIKEQLQAMIDYAVKTNCIALLAIKFKRRGWKYVNLQGCLDGSIDYEDCSDRN